MTHKIAFLFPGQGSQQIGMGLDLVKDYPEAREIFEQADEICAKPISKLCFDGPMEELTLTVNLQPAITATSLACLALLTRQGAVPDCSAGHSLGEYAALVSAGVISVADSLRLVNQRGELMHRESIENPGVMSAVLKMDIQTVERIVTKAKENDVLAVANHNTADQVVITGQKAPMARAAKLVKEEGGKAIPLKVSGAWHSSLMKNAVDEFRRFMDPIPFSEPESTVLLNATADKETDPDKIKDIMAQQLISPVRWYDIVLKMIDQGCNTFVEVGPKKVLTGLVGKIVQDAEKITIHNIEDRNGLERFLETQS